MNTIKSSHLNALLAEASYLLFWDTEKKELLAIDAIRNNLSSALTKPHGEFLLSSFDILTQTLSPSQGFDAVVWRGKFGTDYAGQVYASPRGTQGAQDILDDVSLASRGVPYEQLREMPNWWMRVTAKPGDLVMQIKVDTIARSPLANIYTFAASTQVIVTGELRGQVNTITGVNGHSLGGYLATAFTRLFGVKASGAITFIRTCFSNPAGNAGNRNAWRVFS